MRISLTFIVMIFLSVCTTTQVFAQPDSTATATARARVVKPVSATQTAQLRFGNCKSPGGTGTVTINAQTDAKSFGGNASVNGGNPSGAATFNVTGEPGLSFSVTLPSTPITIGVGNVSNFTQYSASYTLSNLGTGSFKVGGRLNLPNTGGGAFVNYFLNVPITINYQ